ncbi:hypothetical protein FHG87_024314 [Trinorchestia longiramus]|nr:hypothetical protein FHG87_024314 [Trinorchestia longiramus]
MLREGADDTSIVQEKQNASVEQDGSGRTSIEVEGKDDTSVKREDGTITVEQGDRGMTLTETKSKGLNLIDSVIRFHTSRALVHGSLSCIEPDRKDALHDHDRESISVEREYGGIAIADQCENSSTEENGGCDSSKLLDISSDSSFGNDLPHDSCSNSSVEATMVNVRKSHDFIGQTFLGELRSKGKKQTASTNDEIVSAKNNSCTLEQPFKTSPTLRGVFKLNRKQNFCRRKTVPDGQKLDWEQFKHASLTSWGEDSISSYLPVERERQHSSTVCVNRSTSQVAGDASYDVFARVSSSMSEARSIHSEKLYCFRRQVNKKRKALSSDSTSGAVSVKTNSLLISGSTAAKFPTEIRRHFTNPRLDLSQVRSIFDILSH